MSQQVVENFFNPTVKECWLSILKQSYKIYGTKDNSLDLSIAGEVTYISESRHFPAGWLIIRQLNKTKKAAVQEVHLFGRQQNTTKSVLSLNHRMYFQEEIKKKKKIVDIEACEKGTKATPFNISCGPALQGFSGQLIYLNYAPILEFGTDFKEQTVCASFFLTIYSMYLMQVNFMTTTLEIQLRALMLQYIPWKIP